MAKNKLSDLRNHLFATLEALQDEDSNMDVKTANAVANVGKEILETAKLEYQVVRDLGGKTSDFFEGMGIPMQIGEMREAKEITPGNRPD